MYIFTFYIYFEIFLMLNSANTKLNFGQISYLTKRDTSLQLQLAENYECRKITENISYSSLDKLLRIGRH